MTISLKIKTLDSRDHDFTVDDGITVRQFKEHIVEKTGISADLQRLIYCGRVLNDEKPLNEYNVNGKVVHLVERAPPRQQSADSASPASAGSGAGAARSRRTNGRPTANAGQRNVPTFMRAIDGMLISSIDIPMGGPGRNGSAGGGSGVGAGAGAVHGRGINPTSHLCMNRIMVARHMLECANNIVSYLDNPEVGLQNTEMDILSRQTVESTVLEVGISAVSHDEMQPGDMQNFVQAFQGAVTEAFRQSGLTTLAMTQPVMLPTDATGAPLPRPPPNIPSTATLVSGLESEVNRGNVRPTVAPAAPTAALAAPTAAPAPPTAAPSPPTATTAMDVMTAASAATTAASVAASVAATIAASVASSAATAAAMIAAEAAPSVAGTRAATDRAAAAIAAEALAAATAAATAAAQAAPTVTRPSSNATVASAAAAAVNAAVNAATAPAPPRHQTTSPLVLADVMAEMRRVQNRMDPYLTQYYDILANEPRFADAGARETSQRVFDRMSEALHYMSHAQHAISDLMLDLTQPPPRHLNCRPILIDQSAYQRVIQLPHGHQIIVQPGDEFDAPAGPNDEPPSAAADADNADADTEPPNVHNILIELGQPIPVIYQMQPSQQQQPQDQAGQQPQAQAGQQPQAQAGQQNNQQQQPQPQATYHVVNSEGLYGTAADGVGAQPQPAQQPQREQQPQPQPQPQPQQQQQQQTQQQQQHQQQPYIEMPIVNAQVAQLIQNIVNSVSMYTDFHLDVNLTTEPNAPPQDGSEQPADGEPIPTDAPPHEAAAAAAAGRAAAAAAPQSAAPQSAAPPPPPPRVTTATHPTTATQTRSTPRQHVHMTAMPPHMMPRRGAVAGSPAAVSSFDRFLPCSSHHVRENREQAQHQHQHHNHHHHHHQHQHQHGGIPTHVHHIHIPATVQSSPTNRPRVPRVVRMPRVPQAPRQPAATAAAAAATAAAARAAPAARAASAPGSAPAVAVSTPMDANQRAETLFAEYRNEVAAERQLNEPVVVFGCEIPLGELMNMFFSEPEPESWHRMREPLRAFVRRMFNVPADSRTVSEQQLAEPLSAVHQFLLQSPIVVETATTTTTTPAEGLGQYHGLNSVLQLVRRSVEPLLRLLLEDDSAQFGGRLLRELVTFSRRLVGVTVVTVGVPQARAFLEFAMRALIAFENDVELPPVATFLRSGIVAINELCNTNRSTAADLIEFLTIRQRNSATDSIELMDTDDTITVEVVATDPSTLIDQLCGQQENNIDQVPAPAEAPEAAATPQPTAAADEEDELPIVLAGSEEWHANLPAAWLPTIARDVGRQRRIVAQAPYSDAYLAGMSSKRRKLITGQKLNGSDPRQLLTDGVRAVLGPHPPSSGSSIAGNSNAGASSSNGTATPVTAAAIDEALAAQPQIHEPHGSFEQAMRLLAENRIRTDGDFNAARYPNLAKWIGRKK